MLNCLDLFAGAGGFSEGFLETGEYNILAHVEWEKPMVDTLRKNLISKWNYTDNDAYKSVIQFDIQKTDELFFGNFSDKTYQSNNASDIVKHGLDSLVGNKKIDVIIGGPPCQAYSLAGRAQSPTSMKNDYRNYLFESFVKVVNHYKPKVFVFENVPGILSAKPGDELVINRIYKAFTDIGYVIRKPDDLQHSIYCASDFGVPQDRNRVIIFGVKNDSGYDVEDFYSAIDSLKISGNKKTVRDAIYNMPKFRVLSKPYKIGRRNISHELIGDVQIMNHEARYHNNRDIELFKKWIINDMNHAFYDDKIKFYEQAVNGKVSPHIKYRNLEWDKPSPTVVSHLYKDGLMFIHPDVDQARSITVREAAILQSFPMDYEFVGSTAYCYKMIGNAVPVLFAKAIGQAVVMILKGER